MSHEHDEPHALYETADGVGTIILNRPEARNALSTNMTSALVEATARAMQDDEIRCVVLRGLGPCFASGGDIPGYDRAIQRSLQEHRDNFDRQVADWHLIISRLRTMAKPVLAAVHSTTFGYGFSLVLAADLVLAATNTSFMLPHRHIALTPDAGISYLLPRLIGERHALELALLGEAFDAAKAKDLGIVNWTVSPDELANRTAKLARQLAAGPPVALAQAKALLRTAFERDWATHTALEAKFAHLATGLNDHVEGVAAFAAKRRATYSGH
jgi:2-(1,2-epoxy-1,2-dihydrophenyl)acetyl-CoA isomerase